MLAKGVLGSHWLLLFTYGSPSIVSSAVKDWWILKWSCTLDLWLSCPLFCRTCRVALKKLCSSEKSWDNCKIMSDQIIDIVGPLFLTIIALRDGTAMWVRISVMEIELCLTHYFCDAFSIFKMILLHKLPYNETLYQNIFIWRLLRICMHE